MPGVVCTKLKILIIESDSTQEEVADYLGLAETTFNRKLNGKSEFKLSEAKKLADLFNLTIEELFFLKPVTKEETKSKAS
ncbi:helix-turn-helix transcriptional regulator [Orenia marismortui]|uniref:DNA-binding XRE family transcriptional regulator n=1 Tax=Orenia marismortui TaxID=46469 RepID=A0A4R8GYV2_9FIRM|nr:helix-turn-helix domain-containing protein [Orenia marismortui]TDX49137.1 DNA-binding XRE family transcriptional regulator [Orenia marismortui]